MKHLIKTLTVLLFVVVSITAPADNLLTDTRLSNESGWSFWVNKTVSVAGGSGMLQDGKAVVKSPAIEKQNSTNIQLIKSIAVEADKSYKLKFKVNAEKSGKLSVIYCLNKSPFTYYASSIINIEYGEKEYDCTLAVKMDKDGNYDAPRSLRLLLGDFKDTTVSISDVSFEELK